MEIIFTFQEYWHFYLYFSIFILALLSLDLGVFHKNTHKVSIKEASIWSIVWVSLALIFGVLFYYYCNYKTASEEIALRLTMEFFTGFFVEKALAVDNIFIFVIIFSFLSIPDKLQHKVLFYGIIGALLFRALFIAVGALLMQYEIIVLIFGIFLVLTGIKILLTPQGKVNPENNIILNFFQRRLPLKKDFSTERFLIKENGKYFITPLFLALVFVEFSDIIFAIDSVPAIFAITNEPFIVFTSNVFAILGLRSLYFLLAGVVDKFYLLKYGLGIVLIFVGIKMSYLNQLFGGKFPISWSMLFIVIVISASIICSLLFPKKQS